MLDKLFRKKSITKILEDAAKGYGDHGDSLHKTLGVRDLTAFGIAAIIHYLPSKLPAIVALTSLFTSLKWILIAISVLLILAALVAKLYSQKKKA